MMKQYRSYHMVTAEHDIVENGMIANSDGVYNSIQIMYPEDSDDGNFDGTVGFSDYKKTDEVKADDDLHKDYIKRQTLVFHNAHTDISGLELPQKYSVSALCKSLNNVYKGKIKILGRPGIKPHDIVFVYDSYNSIYGPVEVAAVTHILSYNTGWITEILPHMIVMPATSTSVLHINAIQRMTHSFYLKNIKLFYSGAVFNSEGELEDDIMGEEGFWYDFSNDNRGFGALTSGATRGAATAVGINTVRTSIKVGDASKKIEAVRRLTTAKKVSKLGIFAKTVGFGMSRLFGAGIPLLGDIAINYAIDFYVNWSKYRQPIVFLPVTRNGKPWYTAMYGLNNNTESQAIKKIGSDLLDKADFTIEWLRDKFPETFN